MNWRATITVILLVAAVLSAWSVWRNRSEGDGRKASSGRSDFVLHAFELTALDAAGKESFSMRAPKLQQTPGMRTIDLDTPLFFIPDKQGKHWKVRSNTGWVSEGNDEIRLRGDVVTTSPPGQPNPVTMNTQQLNVFPETNRVTSADAVTIAQPGLTMRGRGMEADLSAKRFTLLSQVRTRYDATRR